MVGVCSSFFSSFEGFDFCRKKINNPVVGKKSDNALGFLMHLKKAPNNWRMRTSHIYQASCIVPDQDSDDDLLGRQHGTFISRSPNHDESIHLIHRDAWWVVGWFWTLVASLSDLVLTRGALS